MTFVSVFIVFIQLLMCNSFRDRTMLFNYHRIARFPCTIGEDPVTKGIAVLRAIPYLQSTRENHFVISI